MTEERKEEMMAKITLLCEELEGLGCTFIMVVKDASDVTYMTTCGDRITRLGLCEIIKPHILQGNENDKR